MEFYHWFWGLLTAAALAWFSTITVYIGIRGGADIKQMLQKLKQGNFDANSPDA